MRLDNDVTVVGIDVGGDRKGLHAVAVCGDRRIEKFSSTDADDIAAWCCAQGAQVIGIDAPCGWSNDSGSRVAERILNNEGVHCFYTPKLEKAQGHKTNFYGWVFNGMKIYNALHRDYPLFDGEEIEGRRSFETFPHAISRALGGPDMTAKGKREQRRNLLEKARIDVSTLTNMDWVDAALCALAGEYFIRGEYKKIGNAAEGFIVVPKRGPR